MSNWTSRVEFFGVPVAKQTDHDTIDLTLSIPRKFRGPQSKSVKLDETQLLATDANYLLLGDPGAGKTTTLKRLARHLLLASDEEVTSTCNYPVVIRLRELGRTRSLKRALADLFGFILSPLEARARHVTQPTVPLRGDVNYDEAVWGESSIIELAATLDDTRALLILDGLDELAPEIRKSTEFTICDLGLNCRRGRIVVSCRSGDYNAQLEGFDVLEICPLDKRQIQGIARRWSTRPKLFMEKLSAQPFGDLASRPLFLCQLLVLFEQNGFIPERPSDVTDRIARLALEDWDIKHKKLPRQSQYASFDAGRKREFLARLALWLTYEVKTKQFARHTLKKAYDNLHKRFRLPKREMDAVVAELETHTGIFVEAGRSIYEFTHLSIQEYLAASVVVREPITAVFADYLSTNPAPVAVAVGLAPSPERWLARVLLHPAVKRTAVHSDQGFFARLLQEQPLFIADRDLGFAAIHVLSAAPRADGYIAEFLRLAVVEESLRIALPFYEVYEKADLTRLRLRNRDLLSPDFAIPLDCTLPAPSFARLRRLRGSNASDVHVGSIH